MGKGRQMSTRSGHTRLDFMVLILHSWLVFQRGVTAAPGVSANVTEEVTCGSGEHPHSDRQFCCNHCLPGQRVLEECEGPKQRTTCERCRNGTFQEGPNYERNCRKCTKCNDLEVIKSECDAKHDRICECKPEFYRPKPDIGIRICLRCKKCGPTEEETSPCTSVQNRTCTPCKHCSKGPSSTPVTNTTSVFSVKRPEPPPSDDFARLLTWVPLTVLVTAVALVIGFGSYKVIKWKTGAGTGTGTKSSLDDTGHQEDSANESTTSSQELITKIYEDHSCQENEAVPFPIQTSHEIQNELPAYHPQEIRIDRFIYSVLDVVPVSRTIELTRLLEVSEQVIQCALHDFPRSIREAQHHILKVWATDGGAINRSYLPLGHAHRLLDALRDMGLGGCAEGLEDKYPLN